MPKLKPESLARRQQHILDAAERCFARLGVQQTTMRDIFDEAQVSAGGMYVHFASKADVIEALATRSSRRDGAVIRQCVVPGDEAATIAGILELADADYRRPDAKHGVRLDIALWAEALHEPRIATLLANSAAAALEAIAGALAEAEGHGKKPGRRHTARARLIAAVILGVAVQWHADPTFQPSQLTAAMLALAPALSEVMS